MRVFAGGSDLKPVTVPATEPVRVWHLLTHTSGLTYGFHRAHPVDALYRAAGLRVVGARPTLDLAGAVETFASLPLLFQPGTEWNYSVSTDVLGRLVEVLTGKPLDAGVRRAGLRPARHARDVVRGAGDDRDRFAALYTAGPATATASSATRSSRPTWLSGGGGLCSTLADYHRFTRFLLSRGELDGVRVLGDRTVRYMTRNHLPGNADLAAFGRPLFAEAPFDGVGFGLGFSVLLDPVATRTLGHGRRVRLGRRGEHRVLGRPGRADHRRVHDPAAAVVHLPDPLAAAPARVLGARRLS